MTDIERIAHMKITAENVKANAKLYDLYDWFCDTPYTQKIQRDIKKMCYNLLRYFDAADFPNGTFSFVNCYSDALYNRGLFKYGNHEFNILLSPDSTEACIYIYDRGGLQPIWKVEGVRLRDAVKALKDQLDQYSKKLA